MVPNVHSTMIINLITIAALLNDTRRNFAYDDDDDDFPLSLYLQRNFQRNFHNEPIEWTILM